MRFLRGVLSTLLFWLDVAVMGVTAASGVIALYATTYFWTFANAHWARLEFPVDRWDNKVAVISWAWPRMNVTTLTDGLMAWGYACAAGFCAVVAILGLYEAYVRLRIRLG